MKMQHSLLVVLLAISAACASAGAARPSDGSSRVNGTVTRVEIDRATQSDAFELLRSLRPNWLRTRGVNSFNGQVGIRVYQDGMSVGGLEVLRSMPTMVLQSIEFLDAPTATQRFGTDHANGAILITTRR